MKKIITFILAGMVLSSCGVYRKYKSQTDAPENLFGSGDSIAQVALSDTLSIASISTGREAGSTTSITCDRWKLYGGYVFFFMLVLILVGTERFLVRYLESFGLRSLYLRVREEGKMPEQHLVLIGGGMACRLFILNLFCRNNMNLPLVVNGIIDDDPALRRLNVYGFPVLGSTKELDSLYQQAPFDMLVVTAVLPEEALERVRTFASTHDIRLGVFYPETISCTPDSLEEELKKLAPPPTSETEEEGML